jgi:hypothetical protein
VADFLQAKAGTVNRHLGIRPHFRRPLVSAERTLIRLTQVPGLIQKAYKRSCTYNQCWRLIVDGKIPAERVGNKLFVDETELPVIAQELKLIPSLTAA